MQDNQKSNPVPNESKPVPSVSFTNGSPSTRPGLKSMNGDAWIGREVFWILNLRYFRYMMMR